MLAIMAIPAFIQFVYFFFIPETKLWLELKTSSNQLSLKQTLINFLPPKIYLHFFILGLTLTALTQLAGANVLFNYAPIIFEKAGFLSSATAIASTTGVNSIQVVATLIILLIINKINQKQFMTWGLILLGAIMFLLGLAFWIFSGKAELPWFVLALVLSVSAVFNFAFGPIAWVIIAEIFPAQVKAKGLALSAMIASLSSVLLAQTYLTLIDKLGTTLVFSIFGIFCFAGAYFLKHFMVNTETLEQPTGNQ